MTDGQLKQIVDKIEEDGYLNACLFVLVADHGMMAYQNADAYNITSQDYYEDEEHPMDAEHQGPTTPGKEMQLIFEALDNDQGFDLDLWRNVGSGWHGDLSEHEAVWSPNGGMAQIYLREPGSTWQEPPSADRIKKVANLLFREARGLSQIYTELGPLLDTSGALGNPPAVFVKLDENGEDHFAQPLKWVKAIDGTANITLGTVEDFMAQRSDTVNWPEFKARLDEMNHKYGKGSRTGDIILIMNSKEGYLAVNHGEDMLNGWHGGPARAESEIPLMFGMCGPNLIPGADGSLNPEFVQQGFSDALGARTTQHFRNWEMGDILKRMLVKAVSATGQ